jgi:multidrug resistance efflux pump
VTQLDADHLSLLETRLILAAYDINTDYRMSISDDIRAARAELAQAKAAVPGALAEAKSVAGSLVAEVKKLKAETAEMQADLASLTNGGPALDEPVGPTILPPVTP